MPTKNIILFLVICYLYLLKVFVMKDTYYIFATLFFIAQKWQNIVDRKLDVRAGITSRQWMLFNLALKHYQ